MHHTRLKSEVQVHDYEKNVLFPQILAFAVTIHMCQCLSLDCTMMDMSGQVFTLDMEYVSCIIWCETAR